MVFSSALFLFGFLPIFFTVYFLINKKHKNYCILVFSFLFYQWGAPTFVYTVLIITFVDFYIVNQIHISVGRRRKLFLVISLLLNIGLLSYFKYANFFIENINEVLAVFGVKSVVWTKVILPIGISFFAFETLTYSIDVYRKVHKPLKNVLDYYTYILLFPKLIAGPIVRFHEIADQINDRSNEDTIDNKLLGFFRFVIGLSKKVLIANVMAKVADESFAINDGTLSAFNAWVGIVAYSFQIYFDFSGYSDMAIGLGRMMGFRFIENFNNPYTSTSITEFWRRWHMSLGRWMRDYLYIPLGGNQFSKSRMYLNLWIVFVVSGLWHGAAWNFIIWGAFHGLFLIADRIFLLKIYERIGKFPSILITYIITLLGWVLFRANSLTDAIDYIKSMFSLENRNTEEYHSNYFYFMLIIAFVFAFAAVSKNIEKAQLKFYEGNYSRITFFWVSLLIISLLLISLSFVLSSDFNPFIYFRF